jgi:hypothetical protein
MNPRPLVSLLVLLPVLAQVGCGSSSGIRSTGGNGHGGQAGAEDTTSTGDQVGSETTKHGASGGQGGGSGGQVGTGERGGTGSMSSSWSSYTSPSTGTGAAPAAKCTGSFDAVNALWGFECPPFMCDRDFMAGDCRTLPPNVTRRTTWSQMGKLFEFEFSGTHGRGCIYSEDRLMAVTAWDDVPTYCNGTSRTIVANAREPKSGDTDWSDTSWRDKATPQICERTISNHDGDAGSASTETGLPAVPPATCFNRFGRSCEPCCPTPAPDCSGQADGYPGYACTSTANPYCSCSCYGGKWQCLC